MIDLNELDKLHAVICNGIGTDHFTYDHYDVRIGHKDPRLGVKFGNLSVHQANEFFVAAFNEWPALRDRIRALEGEVKAARKLRDSQHIRPEWVVRAGLGRDLTRMLLEYDNARALTDATGPEKGGAR